LWNFLGFCAKLFTKFEERIWVDTTGILHANLQAINGAVSFVYLGDISSYFEVITSRGQRIYSWKPTTSGLSYFIIYRDTRATRIL
jgi:hypothetical protein